MKHRYVYHGLTLLAMFLALAPSALAANTWYVDGVNGNDNNDCKTPHTACKTIGHTISLASAGDSILVAAATYTETLTIGFGLKVIGSGASATIIDGGGAGPVLNTYNTDARVTLSKVTVRNGQNELGGGITNLSMLTINHSIVSGNTGRYGGGIYNYLGTLTINDSTISGNNTGNQTGSGGGIYNASTLAINNSTLGGNSAADHGGAIYNENATLTINNCTLSRNSVLNFSGGGIDNEGKGTVMMNNSTVTGNSAVQGGGIYNHVSKIKIMNSTLSENSAFEGGGIFNNAFSTAEFEDTIVAKNQSGGNCYGTVQSENYNLSGDNSCNFNKSGDLNNTDPKLGPLRNNGGPTQTQALLSGSPAIDAGNPSGCTDSRGHLLKTDQRGRPRPDKEDSGGCDMGAYERQKD
jgi:hypothetical protein